MAPIPAERWDAEAYFDADPQAEGRAYVRRGSFLDRIDEFDAGFFRVSPREAKRTDPQHRLVLESAWTALEHAGLVPAELTGTRTGVFMGIGSSDYDFRRRDVGGAYTYLGTQASFVAGRVAHSLGLRGPTFALDTGCSTSLVALHSACRALQHGECELALAGAVQLMAAPDHFVQLAKIGALAPDGRCKTFSAKADGFGRGEGVVVLALEPLERAEHMGRNILAVVEGTAVNHNGPQSTGIMAPNADAQRELLRAALEDARLDPEAIDLLECHGTGTRLGDRTELRALGEVFGPGRSAQRPLLIGSVKTNLGHLEVAAGMAGVAKVLASMRHGAVPPSLHTTPRTEAFAWDEAHLEVVDAPTSWPRRRDRGRRAGVSSFGMAGTNAHVILADPPSRVEPELEPDPKPSAPAQTSPLPLLVSGREALDLRAQVDRLTAFLRREGAPATADLAYSLATSRTHFDARLSVSAAADASPAALADALEAAMAAREQQPQPAPSSGKLAMLFTGQGSQWPAMARAAWSQRPVFRDALEEVCAHLDPLLDAPVRPLLLGEVPEDQARARLAQTASTQPAIFALELALYRLWTHWGVKPDLLLGHSVGEIAVAHVAGVLDLPDACALVAARGRLMQALPAGGAMIAIQASEAELRPHLDGLEEQLAIAAINGPSSTVVSGDAEAARAVEAAFAGRGRKTKRLDTSHAFHSPRMQPMLEDFAAALGGLRFGPATVLVVSTLTGRRCEPTTMASVDYWLDHARSAVRFLDGVRSLEAEGVTRFLELGPQAVLASAVPHCLSGTKTNAHAVASLAGPRFEGAPGEDLSRALGELYTHGQRVDWRAVFATVEARRCELPTYAFRRERHWLEGRPASPRSLRYTPRWVPVEGSASCPGACVLVVPQVWAQGAEGAARLAELRADETTSTEVSIVDEDVDAATWLDALPTRAVALVSLLALDDRPDAALPGVSRGLRANLALTQACARAEAPPRLWLVTRGAVSVSAEDPLTHPTQAMTWALGRALGLEHPSSWGGLIDLGEGLPLAAALSTLVRDDGEDELAARADGIRARRLVPLEGSEPTPRPPVQLRGAALITGGTGALGLHIARWLVERGAESLILVSRRGPASPGIEATRAELEGLGASVSVVACALDDRRAVAELLTAHREDLRAIVHAAGIPGEPTPLRAIEAEQLAAVAAGKVAGAQHLHALSRELGLELELFLCLSSMWGVWGSGPLMAYAGANAYLDALATHRRQAGLPAAALAWGPWAEGGMVDAETLARLGEIGLRSLAPSVAIHELGALVDHGASGVLVADVDWPRFCSSSASGGARPLFAELPQLRADAAGADLGSTSTLATELRAASPEARRRALVALILDTIRAVLELPDDPHTDARLRPEVGFYDLGLDSVLCVELCARLGRELGARLSVVSVFENPRPAALAAHLDALVFGATTTAAPARALVQADEAIAIVGIGLRLPGGVVDLDSLWTLLEAETDAVGPVPRERWDAERFFDPDPDRAGKSYTREGAFLDAVDRFDAAFFNISPREARHLDPQQRLLLEATWEALERAHIVPGALAASRSGVFVGLGPSDYAHLQTASGEVDAYTTMGTHTSFGAGRLAFYLGLRGPAITLDTACSSSLVALHCACASLRAGECELAVAASSQVMVSPHFGVQLSRTRALAPDGRCKTFSAAADGYGRGEGVIALALQRLSDAEAEGRRVLAVVRGSAVNHDGASSGLTVPNGAAQREVLRAALASAKLEPWEIDAVECHGTGTKLGDPIEVRALAEVYGEGRAQTRPLLLGALKTNVGHLESAAGLAGVAKVLASLQRGAWPASLHTSPRNPHLDWDSLPVAVVDRLQPWTRRDQAPRRAGVSSFGLSGTNAHVILEEAPALAPAEVNEVGDAETPALPARPLLLSGRNAAALRAQAERLRAHLDAHPELDIGALAATLATARTHFERRACVLAHSHSELLEGLDALAHERPHPSLVDAESLRDAKLVFVFPGQGSQWPGMAREWLADAPAFAEAMRACDEALAPHTGWSVLELLRGGVDAEALARVDVVQPTLFAVMVSLAAVWRAFGVVPDAVIGHSQGEIAAACVAGALSLEDAARVVALRSQVIATSLQGEAGQAGAMAAVSLPAAELEGRLGEALSVAVDNGPRASVVAGPPEAVAQLVAQLRPKAYSPAPSGSATPP
ncbi:modular polyketide synthase, partial [Plesiocystis pacifica SIR-1]